MKKLAWALVGFVAGMALEAYCFIKDVEDGDVIYEDDKMYVKASDNKTYGYSIARVNYKNSDYMEKEDEEA